MDPTGVTPALRHLFVVHAAVVLPSGYADDWVAALFRVGPEL